MLSLLPWEPTNYGQPANYKRSERANIAAARPWSQDPQGGGE